MAPDQHHGPIGPGRELSRERSGSMAGVLSGLERGEPSGPAGLGELKEPAERPRVA